MTQRRPLLIIDGDSFAHRSYHALPKTIRRRGDKGAGAILGFANFLLRLYETEKPRAVLVGWDSLDEPTYRHDALEGYQSGRTFDDELVDQLDVLPEFVTACGFANAKEGGYEADDFPCRRGRTRRKTRRNSYRRERRSRRLSACIKEYHHLAADPGGRDGAHWSC